MEVAVCMGMDAMRIALSMPPKNFTVKEVLVWLQLSAALIAKERA